MKKITEIVFETTTAYRSVYYRNHVTKEIYGATAWLYQAYVRMFGKEEADREFWNAFFGKKSGDQSPLITALPDYTGNQLSKEIIP